MKKSVKIIIKAGIAAVALSTALGLSACGNSAAGAYRREQEQSVIERPSADEDLTISPALAGKNEDEKSARERKRPHEGGRQDKRKRPVGRPDVKGENDGEDTKDNENGDGEERPDRPMPKRHEGAIMLIIVPAREGFLPPPPCEIDEGEVEEPEAESTVRGAPTSND